MSPAVGPAPRQPAYGHLQPSQPGSPRSRFFLEGRLQNVRPSLMGHGPFLRLRVASALGHQAKSVNDMRLQPWPTILRLLLMPSMNHKGKWNCPGVTFLFCGPRLGNL